jgi:hypothetical protein
MIKHKYAIADVIINTDDNIGIITSKGTSIIDNVTIPSYWVLYDEKVHPDGCSRNTWEKSIKSKIK